MGQSEIDYNCLYVVITLSPFINVWDVKDCVDEDECLSVSVFISGAVAWITDQFCKGKASRSV